MQNEELPEDGQQGHRENGSQEPEFGSQKVTDSQQGGSQKQSTCVRPQDTKGANEELRMQNAELLGLRVNPT